MVAFCWITWYARNKALFESKIIDLRIVAAKAESTVKAYQRVTTAGDTHLENAKEKKQQKWLSSPKGVFKVNVDAAINDKEQMVGLGAVIRDSNDKVVAAGI